MLIMIGRSTVRTIDDWGSRSECYMIRRLCASLWFCCVLLAASYTTGAEEKLDLGNWSSVEDGRLPENWRLLIFPSISSATRYEVVQDATYGQVVRAESSKGAGGIGRSLLVEPHRYPILNWSWKIAKTIAGSSLSHKKGDDFPVRVMVSFKTGGAGRPNLQDNVLCYVWATTEPIGSVAINPIHSHIKTFAVASGNEGSGEWLEMSRNLVDDYRQAFSEEPGIITGIVLMTDSDNTGSEARGWYGPIWLSGDLDGAPRTLTK